MAVRQSARSRLFLVAALLCGMGTGATADDWQGPLPPDAWAFHGQITFVDQFHPAFASPYRGANSLDPGSRGDETVVSTLYVGLRPWTGAEIWANPEVDQGYGLSGTYGVAAFPSGEAYKIGS